ncbi:cytochrome P450 monooxygenase pc-bph [Amylocystis lapponica]|nr:cytochrome P450 monooxygenase pc-bph [Amylocystis lapponica]
MLASNEVLESQSVLTNLVFAAAIVLPIVLAVHLIPYLVDPQDLRAYPGPTFAKFTDVWMALTMWRGRRSEEVHQLHQRFGTFVRIAPNHVSISSPAALNAVYGHSSGTLKSDFYDTFVSFSPGLFSTRSRSIHARKRRIVAHMFAPQSVRAFQPAISKHISELFSQWDKLCEHAVEGGQEGIVGASAWSTENGRVWFDCVPWINYFAFDTIGDLTVGETFGMLRAGRDRMKVVKSLQAGMDAYDTSVVHHYETEEISTISTLARRSEITGIIAVLPGYWRPFVRRLPWFSQSTTTGRLLMGMTVAAVARRLAASAIGNGKTEEREDMLQRLLEGHDEDGKPMASPELSTEAFTLLLAGSDTISMSASAIVYYVSRDRRVQDKLQAELDAAVGVDADVAMYDRIKHLPYLEAVVNEGLRLHSTLGGGLPRVCPEGGLTVLGQTFKEGTVLSVPAYSVHRDPDVWGADVEEFRPERWLERDTKELLKAFVPFSVGPRACVGRNLAQMELLLLIATVFHRYDTVVKPGQKLQVRDGLSRKPVGYKIGIKRRHI